MELHGLLVGGIAAGTWFVQVPPCSSTQQTGCDEGRITGCCTYVAHSARPLLTVLACMGCQTVLTCAFLCLSLLLRPQVRRVMVRRLKKDVLTQLPPKRRQVGAAELCASVTPAMRCLQFMYRT